MNGKKMVLTFFRQEHVRNDWQVDIAGPSFESFLQDLAGDLLRYGVQLERAENDAITIAINSYADLLNSVRISSPADGFSSLCVGHVIGKSANLDLQEDIRRAVNRVAFAPETIPPEDHNRKVCHNCGCGC
ncbi:hypothetical protein [Geobacter sp. DSM 9736]|uniref:hypothetical protein n=1 Tax=Geobacter sp. DSM 9736 TaxID=1277350 RepID=UPI000B509884|nr:hypothetical protein [Geobacter sp. DSM 9736]SNB45781.1 hypothetical protein SAMN06269301_1210 [Geobacter sp. DSM 9736]